MVSPDDSYDQLYISNYAILHVREQLKRLEGVGDVNLYGARGYSMRVWLDPSRLTFQNLTTTELSSDCPPKSKCAGRSGVSLASRRSTVTEPFKSISLPRAGWLPRSNSRIFHRTVYDPTVFIEESVRAVIHTIFEASLLVVIVVMAFLQSLARLNHSHSRHSRVACWHFCRDGGSRFVLSTIFRCSGSCSPSASLWTMPSLWSKTSSATSRRGSRRGMPQSRRCKKSGGALIAIALVLSAVFVPTAFISGISGQFYRQFALTIAVATLFSAFVSLTLSPALCRILLQPHGAKRDWFARCGISRLAGFSACSIAASARHRDAMAAWFRLSHAVARIVLILYAGLLALTVFGFVKVPGGFIPSQDQGYLIVVAQLPEGGSLSRTDNVVRKITDLARDVEGVTAIVAFAGFDAASGTNAPNKAAVFTRLDSFEERQSLGTAVFSGMLGVTFFGLFLTPVFYVVIRKFTARKKAAFAPPAAEPQVARS